MAASSTNMSLQQKEKLLETLEHVKYRDFAVVNKNCTRSKADCDNFWNRVTPILNSMGPSKLPTGWRRCWRDAVSYTVKLAKSKARIEEGPDGEFIYTMDNKVHDRIMALVGWELADVNNQDDVEDKENDDPLMPAKRKRSLSPLSSLTFGENQKSPTSSPLLSSDMTNKSPVSPAMSSAMSSRMSSAMSSSMSSAMSSKTCNCNCRSSLEQVLQAVERNTQTIEALKAQLQNSLGNLLVLNVEENLAHEDPMLPAVADEDAEEQLVSSEPSFSPDAWEGD